MPASHTPTEIPPLPPRRIHASTSSLASRQPVIHDETASSTSTAGIARSTRTRDPAGARWSVRNPAIAATISSTTPSPAPCVPRNTTSSNPATSGARPAAHGRRVATTVRAAPMPTTIRAGVSAIVSSRPRPRVGCHAIHAWSSSRDRFSGPGPLIRLAPLSAAGRSRGPSLGRAGGSRSRTRRPRARCRGGSPPPGRRPVGPCRVEGLAHHRRPDPGSRRTGRRRGWRGTGRGGRRRTARRRARPRPSSRSRSRPGRRASRARASPSVIDLALGRRHERGRADDDVGAVDRGARGRRDPGRRRSRACAGPTRRAPRRARGPVEHGELDAGQHVAEHRARGSRPGRPRR